jgi:iron complex outermembrane receptor protein
MLHIRGLKMLAITAAMPLTFVNVGLAQDKPAASAGSADLQEIVVTARKREESLQKVPIAIQAFTAQQIEERGARSLEDIAKFTPGLTYNQGNSRVSSDFSIRGMNQVIAGFDNRKDIVTTFIDNIPYIGSPSQVGAEDLARVEVIKGPQSALFGKATFGGAISLITTTPGNEFKSRVSATAATYGDYRLQGSIEGPIVEDKLAARLIVDGSTFNGFYKNALGGRLGESDGRYVAGTLNFTPVESLSIRLRYSNRHDVDGPAASTLIARWPEHNCGPFPGYTSRPLGGLPAGFTLAMARMPYCGELRAPTGPIGLNTNTPAAVIADGLLPFYKHQTKIDHNLGALTANWSFAGGHTLTAITSTQKQNVKQLRDFEITPQDIYQSYAQNDQTQKTYELRVTSPAEQRLSWMLGVARLDNTFNSIGAFIGGSQYPGVPARPTAATLTPARSSSKTDALFASVGFRVTDALNVSLEARRQKDKQTSGIGTTLPLTFTTQATLPRVLASYALTDETNLFANYAKGNQPTQGYATFLQLTPAQQVIAAAAGVTLSSPEATVKNYEIGIKHRAADGRWYLNGSLYYLEWVGRQGVRTIQVDLNGNGVIDTGAAPNGETFNAVPFSAGDSNTKGIELDGAFKIAEHWTVGGAAAYADATITKALNEAIPLRFYGITDAKGFQFPLVPKFSGSAYAQYEAALTDARNWYARADMTYIGKRYDSIADFAWTPGQLRTNLRGGVRTDKWDVSLWINNLFDDKTLESSRYNSDSSADPFFFQLAASEAVLPHKRQIGVTASFRF